MTVEKAGIEAVLFEELYTVLVEHCIDDVNSDDESRCDAVVPGKPTKERGDDIVVSVLMEHPLGLSAERDDIATSFSRLASERPNWFPPEMGGGMVEVIHGAIQINIKEELPYEEAVKIMSSLKERVKWALNTDSRLQGSLADEWGNTVIKFETYQATGATTGGQNTTIHTRWINWRAYIYQVRCDE